MIARATFIWRVIAAMVVVAGMILATVGVRSDARITPSAPRVREFHAMGLAALGRADWEQAVKMIGFAVDQADVVSLGTVRKAELLTDLAVAHRQWAKHGNPQSLIIGLDAAEKAWRLHRAPMTVLNRALLLEELAGPEVASTAWAEYRKLNATAVPLPQPRRSHNAVAGYVSRDNDGHLGSRRHARTSFPAAITEPVVLAECDRSSGSQRTAAEGILLLQSARKALAAQDVALAETRLRQASSVLRKLQGQFAPVQKSDECTDTVARADADGDVIHFAGHAIVDGLRARLLLVRAETLDSMRTTDEAWSERIEAARLRTLGTTRKVVLSTLAITAARDGYFHAADLLFAHVGSSGSVDPRIARWRAFVQSRIDGDRSDPNLYFASAGFVTVDGGIVRAAARFTSPERESVTVSLIGDGTVDLPPRNDWSEPIDELVLEHAQREALGMMVAENVRRLYEHESRVEIADGSAEAALWMSDRARLVGVPWKETSACTGDRGQTLAACVPPGVTVVHQDLDSSRLYTWVVRDGKVDLTTTWVSAPQLRADIDRFRIDIGRGVDDPTLRHQAQHLYDVLLRPVQRQIAGTDLLVYSPSVHLRGVPFAALHDGTRFLVQTRPVAVTPTISAFELPGKAASGSSALLVLPPPAQARAFLDGANREVRQIAGIYRSTLLTDAAATAETFLRAVAAHDVIHVATHGQTGGLPYQNSIDFGRDRIRAYDIFMLTLSRKPIVMLAACRTADNTGGPMNVSLTDAFLAAGASAVVGALWDVEDRSTEQLSVAFHRQLARGATPHDALRHTQLQFIRDGGPMSTWAAFQVSS